MEIEKIKTKAEVDFEFWRLAVVLLIVPLSKASVYRLIKAGDFPAQIKLTSRISVWKSTDVLSWVSSKSEVTT